jgi:hypothetical protein
MFEEISPVEKKKEGKQPMKTSKKWLDDWICDADDTISRRWR